ncbi:hypothetical protein M918_07820 [Clostridium sp. BL8]|uniref:S8 family serine peptidase n=1 Tax=Clostridium sp. BL8 TaxID=1354301 RepID=UPI00038A0B5D|nr:S8 family serine peptidase [Clostridium sp. BL8]EQB87750.1 hypothetical protein M918_07820 [Clostridium sp. BL8]
MEWLNKDVTIYDLINDHYRLSLWGLRCINIEKTWGLCDEKKLSEVIVGLIDSGVEAEHEDLNGNVIEGYNFIHNSRDTCDEFGHGTNVAGVIAAKKKQWSRNCWSS